MSENRLNFTDAGLRKLTPSSDGKRIYLYDKKTPGLRLQLTPAGTITFQFQTRGKKQGRIITTTMGRYPTLPLGQARTQAAELMNATFNGEDIEERARMVRKELTFDELFYLWLEQFAKPHKKSWDEDERRYNLYMKKSLGRRKLTWFTPAKVRHWHQGITKLQKQRGPKGVTISPTTANRAIMLLSTVFNQASPDIPNPCHGVSKFKEKSRDRFLKPGELRRFFVALEDPKTPDDLKDYLMLSLFTGARRSNVLAIKWKDIDFDRQTWTIPANESKNNNAMTIPLVPQAVEVLSRRKVSTSSVFVLPSSRSKTGHYVTPTKAWRSLLSRSGLNGVRLHDLRRTLGSYMAINGCNIVAIGRALGHKNQKTTEVYARMSLDPIRDGMANAVNTMLSSRNLPNKNIRISNRK